MDSKDIALGRREAAGLMLGAFLGGCSGKRTEGDSTAGDGGGSVPVAGQNWAKTFHYSANRLAEPRNLQGLQEVLRSTEHLKPLGSRHSFSRVADTEGTLVSMLHFAEIGGVDKAAKTVTVGGGVKYGDLCVGLDEQGYAIHNLASLPHISIAGAISTATHGSGSNNGNLSTAVQALELVTPAGELRQFSRASDGERFDGVVVSLGALGFITKVTLAVEPRFEMRQYVYENLPWQQLEQNFDAVMDAAYSVSLFTTWAERGIEEVWIKERTDRTKPFEARKELFGATAATRDLHPISALSAEACTPQMGVPGPWYERLPHFKMGFTPSSGDELQSEFFVPRENAVAALKAIAALHKQVSPVLQISEVRAIKADQMWLSTAYGRDSIAIHFTWKKDEEGVLAVLPAVQGALAQFGPRPHWGKVFTLEPASLRAQYPRLSDFLKLRKELDPAGKLRNEFLDSYLGA